MTDVSPKLSRNCRQYLILIKLCQRNVQCVPNSVLATVQGCIFKTCRNFSYKVVGQRRRLKAIKIIVSQKLNVILFFDRIF
jgi:hypothetical protein